MKNHIFLISAIILSISLLLACAEKKEEAKTDMNHEEHDHHTESMRSAMVYEGIIDVESIDANKNGKLFECPMDWNVLSDQAESCPTCGMDLKEYSIASVKENLQQNGYEYKK